MKDMVLLRGMSTSEGSHGRARYYMHTGYREGVGGVIHPSIGAITSARLGKPDDPLPNFVSVGGRTKSSSPTAAVPTARATRPETPTVSSSRRAAAPAR